MADDTSDDKLSTLVAATLDKHVPAEDMAKILNHPSAPAAATALQSLLGISKPDVIDSAGQAVAKQLGIDTIASPNNSNFSSSTSPVMSDEDKAALEHAQWLRDISQKAEAVRYKRENDPVTKQTGMIQGLMDMAAEGVKSKLKETQEYGKDLITAIKDTQKLESK